MTSVIQIGSPGGNGPYICDYGLMRLNGDVVTISFWDGWPEKEITFDHTDEAARDAALTRCQAMQAAVEVKQVAADAEWRARPWWRKLWWRA